MLPGRPTGKCLPDKFSTDRLDVTEGTRNRPTAPTLRTLRRSLEQTRLPFTHSDWKRQQVYMLQDSITNAATVAREGALWLELARQPCPIPLLGAQLLGEQFALESLHGYSQATGTRYSHRARAKPGQAAFTVPSRIAQRRLHADGFRSGRTAEVFRPEPRAGDRGHAASAPRGTRHLRRLSSGCGGHQGRSSLRIRTPAPASACMRDGGELNDPLHTRFIRCSPRGSRRPAGGLGGQA